MIPSNYARDEISNNLIFDEVRLLRSRVDKLEGRINYLFGGLGILVVAAEVIQIMFHMK